MVLFENKTYKVVLTEDREYSVVNKDTEVVEGVTTVLPKAILMAEEYVAITEMLLHKATGQTEGVTTNVVSIGSKGKDRPE